MTPVSSATAYSQRYQKYMTVVYALALHGFVVLAVMIMPDIESKPPAPPLLFETIDLATYEALTGAPDDVAAPEPEAIPEPEPIPEPKPIPETEPIVEPEPIPEPELMPEPEPNPVLELEPIPEPNPKAVPKPTPEPVLQSVSEGKKIQQVIHTPPVIEISTQRARKAEPSLVNTDDVASSMASLKFVPPDCHAANLGNPKPIYPLQARKRNMEGVVLLRIEVSIAGVPLSISILESSGFPVLDRSARQAVQHWKFTPATKGGVAVTAMVEVPINFKLTEG
ncbi:MAG: energy transducer TonB [Rhodospirillales bacterium]|jgi:periplasmic protein TonB|nr:energy transducer TonB [Rhodospirillales bacterium]